MTARCNATLSMTPGVIALNGISRRWNKRKPAGCQLYAESQSASYHELTPRTLARLSRQELRQSQRSSLRPCSQSHSGSKPTNGARRTFQWYGSRTSIMETAFFSGSTHSPVWYHIDTPLWWRQRKFRHQRRYPELPYDLWPRDQPCG
jgi:hypothetical protein